MSTRLGHIDSSIVDFPAFLNGEKLISVLYKLPRLKDFLTDSQMDKDRFSTILEGQRAPITLTGVVYFGIWEFFTWEISGGGSRDLLRGICKLPEILC